MGITPPYLYNPASQRDSDPCYNFDPKAVTRASYYSVASSTSSPKAKREGPLIDFNQHPDSYVIIPSDRPPISPLHPNTKHRIIATRWVLFALRIVQLLGAVGALICVICIRGVNDVQGWILRIPPAFDLLACCYAIYHLGRPAKARPAASSAGYSAFSIFVDIGLLPFYVFIAFYSEANWSMAPGAYGRWSSFFHSDGATGRLLLATFLIGSIVGALHLISVPMDIYLLIVFRKITYNPADMNPLEDNLTSRVSGKHKYKNSEYSATLSGSTLNLSSPSRVSTGKDQLVPEANVPFYQSRTNLDSAYSGHTQESARLSRFEYQQAASNRASQIDMHRGSESRSRSRSSRPHSQGYSLHSQRSFVNMDHEPMPRPLSFVTAENRSRHGTPQPSPQASLPAGAVKDQQKQSLLNDNWYVLGEDKADLSSPRRTPVPELESDHDGYEYHEPHASQMRLASEEYQDLLPQPLCTHPPTPPKHTSFETGDFYFDEMGKDSDFNSNYLHASENTIGRALTSASAVTVGSAVSAKSSFYSQGTSETNRSGTPKGKFYGDLASATKNIRGLNTEQAVPRGQGRVISRSGVDISDASALYVSEDSLGMRGRQVSGKIAEEGLGGDWVMRKREVSGFA